MLDWFTRLIDPFADHTVEQPPRGTIAFFRYFLRPVKGILAAIIVISLITSVIEMMLYVFLGQIVDRVTASDPETFFGEHWLYLAMVGVVILILRPLSLLIQRGLVNVAFIPSLTALVRWQNYRYVLRQSMTFFQNDFAGRVTQKIMQTGQAFRETVMNLVDSVWTMLIYLVGIAFLFVKLDPLLLVPIGFWLVTYFLTIRLLIRPVARRSVALAEANSVLSGRVVDGYSNIQSVKLFAHAQREEAFALEGFRRQIKAFQSLQKTTMVMMVSLNVMNSVLIFGTGAIAVWLWTRGVVTPGGIALAVGLTLRLNQLSGFFMRHITNLFENIGMVENGIQTISRPLAITDRPSAPALAVPAGEIRFENVSFHYGKPGGVIDNLSLVVRPGEKVGLVGRSGAGKSTLVNLLLRFYDVEAGRILIDGQDIAEVDQESLRARIAMVTQDTSLLHRSVRDNIRYGRQDATMPEIEAAARQAEAHQFIEGLRDFNGRSGYEAFVGERGVKLSGGQRQRIAIARLILKDAPILVLDEATSALDSEVEASIQQQLYGLMAGRTVIAIAHRLSTIAILDRLVVMDEGRIIEVGTHAELLAKGGLYAALWHRQSGGFLGLDTDGPGRTLAGQAAE